MFRLEGNKDHLGILEDFSKIAQYTDFLKIHGTPVVSAVLDQKSKRESSFIVVDGILIFEELLSQHMLENRAAYVPGIILDPEADWTLLFQN